jgi:ABC-2 type transport system ATP-binding protein
MGLHTFVMNAIEVNGLTKFYGQVLGIQDLNFTVPKGEIFGFLGPNGAGKTTTIRLLMQLLKPNEGEIKILGEKIQSFSVSHRENIGYLPGDFAPYGTMKVGNYLNYMSKFRKRPPHIRDQLKDKLNFNESQFSQKIKHLSHGNRQKLGIIFALEHDPDLVILDEPSSGLDPLIQEAFYEILMDFHQRGKTIFLSSHILPEVEKVCHQVAIIKDGQLVTLESMDELKKKRPRRLHVIWAKNYKDKPPLLEGTQVIENSENQTTYLVEGNIPEILKSLAGLPVEDIIFPEPNLEDIFLAYYGKENQ